MVVFTLTVAGSLQETGTSRGGGALQKSREYINVEGSRSGRSPLRPTDPSPRTTRSPQMIALKDGDPIPEGYKYVVAEVPESVPTGRTQFRGTSETVDLTTPPKAAAPTGGEKTDDAKAKERARQNLTRNKCRKANTEFAKELKESLATGQAATIKVVEDEGHLKAIWHAAAKELAYKFLDLRKESWKDYTQFERSMVHNELNTQHKFDPPIDPKTIDHYLAGHLRTSRAVWKVHWKKFGADRRHPNCPEAAWQKLTKWWPTDECKEKAAEMASRRARVERTSKVGPRSLMSRMDAEVRTVPLFLFQVAWTVSILLLDE
jgi:hypothetical protein